MIEEMIEVGGGGGGGVFIPLGNSIEETIEKTDVLNERVAAV
jgi:hypothetical protein